MTKTKLCFIFLFFSLSVAQYTEASQSELTLYYLKRPPFSFDVNSEPQGLIVDITKAVLSNQGLKARFQSTDEWTILLNVLKSDVNACYLGSYKTEEREKIYKFSSPVYQEKPYLIVANKKVHDKLGDPVELETLMQSEFLLGVQSGFSYGNVVDKALKSKTVPPVELLYVMTQGNVHDERHVFTLINNGRIDYMFLNAEEYWWNVAKSDIPKTNIRPLNLNKSLEGINRYLMCSKAVLDSTIKQLNNGIKSVHATDAIEVIVKKYRN